MSYEIRYSHTSDKSAETMADAKDAVRKEAVAVREAASAQNTVVFVRADGDVYAYLDQAAADADDTGAAAFAVITEASAE